MPSIVSESSLLLLDPHHSWSASPQIAQPGGPLYDFVENADDPSMQNQLAAFSSLLPSSPLQLVPYDGTIIRIPLRTLEQSNRNSIVKKGQSTEPEYVRGVFKEFAEELVETLLFLRNVQKIILRIGEEIYADAHAQMFTRNKDSNDFSITDKGIVNTPYEEVLVRRQQETASASFLMHISICRGGQQQIHKFSITHRMRSSLGDDEELRDWARAEKLFPWAAIACPLEVSSLPFNAIFNYVTHKR